ncbi:helix-turn-helix transcriptional regulator [Streptomyces sp. NEAU-H22]|uniref:helix-turn-helix domain-containing protein n=1 Tax=Streptomyces sp. NEAU-H22 TaxID=2994655 RepID=UPI002253ED9B|nr:helix-turn-helix transcriptional regulator [Streptomyces sp. NEAU-H22]MCX3290051.1 helix-turn-helix transcriptional regulator [Streptomyces sp. NEAU-H22]
MKDTTLADLRKLSGLSQLEVARRMGVSRGRPGQIERDFPDVRFAVVQAYVRALGGRIEFTAVGGHDVWADEITQHPDGPRDHGDRTAVQSAADPVTVEALPEDERQKAAAWRSRHRSLRSAPETEAL